MREISGEGLHAKDAATDAQVPMGTIYWSGVAMTEPTLIAKRSGKSFRQFQARASWMGDEDLSGHLTAEQKEAIKAMNNRERRITVPVPKWGAIIGAMLCLGAIGFVIWKIVDALPRFIEAWR